MTKASTPLSLASLRDIKNTGVPCPSYRENNPEFKTGVVHIGPGAFFRAHQAWYTHMAMQLSGGNWGITGVSMRSAGVAQALTPQNGLYCLAELDKETKYEVVGAIERVLVAQTQYAEVIDTLVAETTKFVTLTITEKGYCLNNVGKLDLENIDVATDLKIDTQHKTAIGLLSHALKQRWQKGLPCLCVISCDNVTDNGKKLKQALIQYAQLLDADYSSWLKAELVCPCTMVDSITPATDDALKENVQSTLGIKDNWPIKREAFVQWVIEDSLPEEKPDWLAAGVIFTNNVNGFEKAKLRLLNCPHSSLAYLGTLMGIETVYDAMQNQDLVAIIQNMIDQEILPSVQAEAPKELDARRYSEDILERFRNPSIRHLLSQIAWDGSQKLPMRILPIVEQNLSENLPINYLCKALVAWVLFIRLRYTQNPQQELVDPLATKLLALAAQCSDQTEADIALFLSLEEVFSPQLIKQKTFINAMQDAYKELLPLLGDN